MVRIPLWLLPPDSSCGARVQTRSRSSASTLRLRGATGSLVRPPVAAPFNLGKAWPPHPPSLVVCPFHSFYDVSWLLSGRLLEQTL